MSYTPFDNAPLKTDRELEGAEGSLGEAWQEVNLAENALAEKLASFPEGTTVILQDDKSAWFLRTENGQRVLCHVALVGTAEEGFTPDGETASRFDFGLMFVDVGEDELHDYARRVRLVTENFTPATPGWMTESLTCPFTGENEEFEFYMSLISDALKDQPTYTAANIDGNFMLFDGDTLFAGSVNQDGTFDSSMCDPDVSAWEEFWKDKLDIWLKHPQFRPLTEEEKIAIFKENRPTFDHWFPNNTAFF